jgi:murein DD-endopeptidase MepM/ murein hydrolase activator NlpD
MDARAMTSIQRFPVDLTRAARIYFRDTFGDPRPGGRLHAGQDLFAPRGTPVVSPIAGRVVRIGDRDAGTCGFGVTIRADEDRALWTLCHFNAIPVVDAGDRVQPGDVLGVVGTSGNAPERSPHLHIQALTQEGIPINIFPILDAQRRAERAGLATPSPAMQAAATARARPPIGSNRFGTGGAIAALALLGVFTFARGRGRHG